MWVFTTKGFYSIVADKNDPNRLLVRSRIEGDIEKQWPRADVDHTPDSDYAYRTFLPRKVVAQTLAEIVSGIKYTNFKASIEDKRRREDYYSAVWNVMATLQADNAES